MSHIYWELHEISIPTGGHVNHNDGRVYLMSDIGNGKKSRRVIGHATSEKTMHPNDTFKYLYPGEWKAQYGDGNLPEHELHAGMFAATLGIGYKTQIYPIIQKAYGPLYGNAIMDFAMFSILNRSDTAQIYKDFMADQVLFSKEAYSDNWYSDLFKRKMTGNMNHQFRSEWIKHCADTGVKKVWISIDGSNNDCNVSDSDLSEHGKAKSHTNSKIVSYIWAVNAEDGTPVTYFVNNGSMVDSKAFQELTLFLGNCGITIEGVILDRGFCSYDVIETLKTLNIQYVLMLKNSTYAHEQMMEKYAEDIRWKVKAVIDDSGLFGTSAKVQLFKHQKDMAFVSLFYDGTNGSDRMIAMIAKVRRAAAEARKTIESGKKPIIPKDLAPYLTVTGKDLDWGIEYNYEEWQKALNVKGFSSIASSVDRGAEEVNRIYNLRDASEKQFMIMKSQLGFDTTRVHSDESIESRFSVCFVAAIIRSEIMKECKALSYDTNRMIQEINRITFVLLTTGVYASVNNHSERQINLMNRFGMESEVFATLADDVNIRRNSKVVSQKHEIPSTQPKKKKPGRPPKEKTDDSVKENLEAADAPKKKPGRPKGSLNKKKIDSESGSAERSTGFTSDVKRRPGRPKGSKNKPKTEQTMKRKRGRPKGSKNKQKS